AGHGSHGGHLPRPAAPVEAQAVDVQAEAGGVGLDLEGDVLALVDADVGGEALDAGVPRPVDVPLAGGVAGLGGLAGRRGGRAGCSGSRPGGPPARRTARRPLRASPGVGTPAPAAPAPTRPAKPG